MQGMLEEGPELRRVLEALVGIPATEGNQIEVLKNGDQIFPSMLEAIRGAERTIDMLTFVYWTGDIAVEFAGALSERARAGVRVRLLLDSIGARRIEKHLIEQMDEAGVHVRWFRPLHKKPLEANHRTHRKTLVVDEESAHTGGVGIAEEWCGDARNSSEWRDSHFKITGPAVDGVRAAFAQNWAEAGGDLIEEGDTFPAHQQAGESTIMVVRGSSDAGWSDIATVTRALITTARERIRITTAYLNPEPETVEVLTEAVERGVEVEILVPGEHIDKKTSQVVAEEEYADLLERGIRVRKYKVSMLHAKIMTVDGRVSMIGSANFNRRSMQLDEEVVAVLLDPEITQELDSHYEEDIRRSEEVDPERWENRGALKKTAERVMSPVKGFF